MKLVNASALAVALSLGTAMTLIFTSAQAQISISVSVNVEPPVLPVYVQPPVPAPGYIWTPGYWAWDSDVQDYYWVPGTWVMAPQQGYLWTPPYWGWNNGAYLFHTGYWGPHIGFYGGVPYGFGYTGDGYEGGYWQGGAFYYNRTVNNVTDVAITNVYEKTVVVSRSTNVSFNGGPGGIKASPTSEQLAAEHEHHIEATSEQTKHLQMAHQNRSLFASVNHGKPAITATSRPGVFAGHDVVKAHGASGPKLGAAKLPAGGAMGTKHLEAKKTATPGKTFGKPKSAPLKERVRPTIVHKAAHVTRHTTPPPRPVSHPAAPPKKPHK